MGLDQTTQFCQRHPELSAILICPGERRGSIAIHPIALEDDGWRSLVA